MVAGRSVPDRIDAYKVLQVDPEADLDVIQAAYRRLAQKYHPDVGSAGGAEAERMISINRAWEVLKDPKRRAAYDLERRTGGLSQRVQRPDASGRGGPGTTSRPAAEPEIVSRDWTPGRSTVGGGYDPASMGARQGTGAAGPPPGNPSGSVLNFGRYAGWSLGEIARRDLEYIEWLDRTPIGRPYREEIDVILRTTGRRRSPDVEASERRGLFRRR
jgi:curved DNA-binding protein CbpA